MSSFSPGMAGSGCRAFLVRDDIEPVTSDILRPSDDPSDSIVLELLLPGVAGRGRPAMLSVLDGSLGLLEPFCEEDVVGVANDDEEEGVAVVGGALGRSHDDCPVCGL